MEDCQAIYLQLLFFLLATITINLFLVTIFQHHSLFFTLGSAIIALLLGEKL